MPHVASEPTEDVGLARDLPAGRVILTPPICTMGEDAHFTQHDVFATLGNGRHLMMGDDPRMPKMPAQPRLADFFRQRFVPMVANHLLQSASRPLQGLVTGSSVPTARSSNVAQLCQARTIFGSCPPNGSART